MRYLISIAAVIFALAMLAAFAGEAWPAIGSMLLVSQAAYYIGRLHERSKAAGSNANSEEGR
jgi:hypothetical protein